MLNQLIYKQCEFKQSSYSQYARLLFFLLFTLHTLLSHYLLVILSMCRLLVLGLYN